MEYKEYKTPIQDLFWAGNNKYTFVQCISSDLRMAAGIALVYNQYFETRLATKEYYNGSAESIWDEKAQSDLHPGWAVHIGRVINLVTKRNYYNKPTIENMKTALYSLRDIVISENIKYLAMPKIGCGLDGLRWNSVYALIMDIFKDVDVEIVMCYL